MEGKVVDKKQVLILLVVTNLVTIGVVSLLFVFSKSRQENVTVPQTAKAEPNHIEHVQAKSSQTFHADVNSLIAQYDIVKSDRYRQAMEAYGKAIKAQPPYTAESGTQATYYADHGENNKAIETGEQEIQDTPQWPNRFYALAWVYAKVGKYDKAMEVCRKTIELHPDYPYIWHISAWINAKTGQPEKAIADCNQALKRDPESAKTNYALGRVHGMLGQQQEAIDAYKKTVELKPDWAEPYLFLGLTYAELGNQDEAIKSYKEAIHFDKHYPEAYLFLGVAYDGLGRCNKAIESFEQAITEYYSPGNAERIHSLGMRPDLTNIYCAIGLCQLKLGQPYEATVAFKQAIEIDDQHAWAHYGLALADLLLGDKKSALEEYQAFKTLKDEETAKPLLDAINKMPP
jgi:tetratricopeptide (TPR) repeat protein